ncbi:lytic transglycosylase domain-containing protein [Altererythrobacter sp. CAU 1778]
MSSMVRNSLVSFAALAVALAASPTMAQEAAEWDRARAQALSARSGQMASAISRWQYLSETRNLPFESYASFLTSYPGMPKEETLRLRAEGALENEFVSPERLLAYFDRFPPLSNLGRAQYALALQAANRQNAPQVAREAWRGGKMTPVAEATLFANHGASWNADDHDTRMDALLWQGEADQAARQIAYVAPQSRDAFMARLALLQGENPNALTLDIPADIRTDPGYLYNRSRYLRARGQTMSAIRLMADHPPLTSLPTDQQDWVTEILRVASAASPLDTVKIATKIDQAFAPGEDISKREFKLRDDYTTLMWKGGTNALWRMGDAASAAPLFYRYGAAAQTPQTRSKGFYWAGLAAQQAGDMGSANRYYEMAAQYPERFYGQLALQSLGRTLPNLAQEPQVQVTQAERDAFYARPIVGAVREVARSSPWATSIHFFRELADSADTPAEHFLVQELARSIGRRDLAVIGGEAAAADALANFDVYAFPTITTPATVNDWTMVHAITRQESQFAQNALSHAGARGLMQLMPGTAKEQAGMLGRSYMSSSLIDDPNYNITLGDAYFARMMDYFGGAHPLAIAAYNAGPGNVNKWLRANGDPRKGGIGWVEWMEKIPIYETKNYVQRVIENAVVYEAMNPGKVRYGGPKPVSYYLRR